MSNDQIPKKLVNKHYGLLVAGILQHHAMTGKDLGDIVASTVGMVGLVRVKGTEATYELGEELKAEAQKAISDGHKVNVPSSFTEDEAVLFTACQIAYLDMTGKLEEMQSKIQAELEKLTAELEKLGALKTDTPDETKQKESAKILSLRKNKNGDGPTFH